MGMYICEQPWTFKRMTCGEVQAKINYYCVFHYVLDEGKVPESIRACRPHIMAQLPSREILVMVNKLRSNNFVESEPENDTNV